MENHAELWLAHLQLNKYTGHNTKTKQKIPNPARQYLINIKLAFGLIRSNVSIKWQNWKTHRVLVGSPWPNPFEEQVHSIQ